MKNAETFKKKVTYLLKSRRANYRIYNGMLFKVGIITLMTVQLVMAAGTIKGRVFDKNTENALSYANVVIKGTTIGAAADQDGTYFIHNVPAGEQTVIVSYIGYETMSVVVTVPEDGTVIQDFGLEPTVISGKEVVVTGQAAGQIAAINQQISSNTITNVVSKDRIHELPDDNAAAALSRLPGISLQDGDKVVIRGVQSKLNMVLVNGVQLPSTDMNDRSTNLGFISSNLLSGIEVIKALTPDMDANAIGGVVNLRLREAPSGFHFDLFSQGGYNTLDRTTDNYKIWASVSNRFLRDKLGVFIQGNADRSNIGQDIVNAGFQIYGIGDNPYGEAPYQMQSFTLNDQWNEISNGGGSVILDYVLPKGKIVIQNTYANNINDNTTFRNIYGLDVNRSEYAISRDKYGKDLMINALQSEYNFGKVKAELSLSHSYANKYTDLRYGDIGQPMSFYNNVNPHPFGYDDSGNPIQYINERRTFTLDDVLDLSVDSTDAMDARVQGWIVARDEAFKQHIYNSTLDFTIPVAFSKSISSKFKIGGKFTRSERENDVEADFNGSYDTDYYNNTANFFPNHPNLSPQNPVVFSDLWEPNYKRGKYFLNEEHPFLYAYDRDLMDRYMKTSIAGWTPARHMPYSEREDFDGNETFSAGYLMGDFSIGPRLSLIGGLRYEHYNMNYHGRFVYCTHSVYGYGVVWDTLNTVDRNDDDIFPNLHIRYKITDWADIRLAYTKGISRPDYGAIMPSIYFEPGGYATAGNTNLKPAISTNYDAYLSFYNNKIGLFSLGGFYKKIDNIFFQTSIFYQNLSYYDVSFPDEDFFSGMDAEAPTPSQTITTYINNPHPAYIRGLETEWQTNFWYLPKPLSYFVMNINYTRAWSEMDYMQIRNIDSTYKEGRFTKHKYITKDTIRTARLLHQGDHNLNIALGVDYKGFSGRISFNLQGDVITNVGGRPEEDGFTGNIYRCDFTLQQKLPFLEGLSVSFNGVNILNTPVYTYRKFRREVDGEILKNESSIAYSPRIFQFCIRYSF